MMALDIIYPAAGLIILLGSALGLKLLDRMSGRIPKRLVDTLARPALLQASGLPEHWRTAHRQ